MLGVFDMEPIEYKDGYAFFDGHKFRQDSKSGYYLSTTKINMIRKRLHVYVWEKFNGLVPKGYNIHHFDENKNNNQIENLMCMTNHEHHVWHAKHDRDRMLPIWRKSYDQARIAAAEWHRSDEGRKVNSITHQGIKYQKQYVKKCTVCGKSYRTALKRSKFCSPNCQSTYRRRSGKDDVERKCVFCSEIFTANTYSTNNYCSKECKAKYLFVEHAGRSKGYTKVKNKYAAYISFNGSKKYLGVFETQEQAHEAHLKAEQELIKSF